MNRRCPPRGSTAYNNTDNLATKTLLLGGSRVTGPHMDRLREPLLPVGLLLVIVGLGNWYTGRHKGAEYEQLLAAGNLPVAVEDAGDFRELTPGTTATLLSPLQRGSDEYTLANAKLDFYKVTQSGGRLLIWLGLFCAGAGLIRMWSRARLEDRRMGPALRNW